MSQALLQEYWWIIISVLGGLLVFQFFIQGGQSLLWQLGKTPGEQTLIVNALGRKWELGFTTMVLFGGAFFAAFPLFYATSFGGAYYAWMTLLLTYILQAVSYEYRTKKNNLLGQKTFEFFLHFHGVMSPFLVGLVVASFFAGSAFELNTFRQVTWQGPLLGLELLGQPFNLLLGLSMVFLARILGALFLINNIADSTLVQRARQQVLYNAAAFLPLFLGWLGWLMFRDGFAVNPLDGTVTMEAFKYLHNLLQMPVFGVLQLLLGLVLVLWGLFLTWQHKGGSLRGFWPASVGVVLVVMVVLFLAGFNDTAFYPSTSHLASSLTIRNASSGQFTLQVMSWVSFFIPLVLAYIAYVWSQMSKSDVTEQELNAQPEKY